MTATRRHAFLDGYTGIMHSNLSTREQYKSKIMMDVGMSVTVQELAQVDVQQEESRTYSS